MPISSHSARVCVIGLGYIGLPTSLVLARAGHQVRGVDVNANVVETLRAGILHIVDPDLDAILKEQIGKGSFHPETAPAAADVFIIAVPTPFQADHVPDMKYVQAAVTAIAPVLTPGNLVIIESTSPVGTTEQAAADIQVLRPDLAGGNQVHFAYCPERVLPGRILLELVENDRIVGGVTTEATTNAVSFYRTFVTGQVLSTNARTAELVKLTENAFRDVNIAFANEVGHYSEKLNINPWEVIRLANHHPRVRILNPGPGVGGHCIAVDPWFIVHAAPDDTPMIKTARMVNDRKPQVVIAKAKAAAAAIASQEGRNPHIVCLGLTYKPDVDDLRESPALEIAHALTKAHGQQVTCVDPLVEGTGAKALEGLYMQGLDVALKRADIIVALVPHKQFRAVLHQSVSTKIVIDTVGLWQQD